MSEQRDPQPLLDAANTILKVAAASASALTLLLVIVVVTMAVTDHTVVVKPLEVPNEVSGQGQTGALFAALLVSEVRAIDTQSRSQYPGQQIDQDRITEISFPIPDTTLSFDQLRYGLANVIGDRREIAGQVTKVGTVYALYLHGWSDSDDVLAVQASDIQCLIRRAAERLVEREAPYTAAMYLLRSTTMRDDQCPLGGEPAPSSAPSPSPQRTLAPESQNGPDACEHYDPVALPADETTAKPVTVPPSTLRARQLLLEMTMSSARVDRAWGFVGLSIAVGASNTDAAKHYAEDAIKILPDFAPAQVVLANAYALDGAQGAYPAYKADLRALHLLLDGNSAGLSPRGERWYLTAERSNVARYSDDFEEAAREDDLLAQDNPSQQLVLKASEIMNLVSAYRYEEASDLLRDVFSLSFAQGSPDLDADAIRINLRKNLGVIVGGDEANEIATNLSNAFTSYLYQREDWRRLLAYAERARQKGDRSDYTCVDLVFAHAKLDPKADLGPLSSTVLANNTYALTERADIYEDRGDLIGEIAVLRKATELESDVAMHWASLGYALGKSKSTARDAEVAFKKAYQKAPQNPFVSEKWGESLVTRNRADLALPRFTLANALLPQWGRLHLKWGEALKWTGEGHAAERQFDLARKLALTDHEKRELQRVDTRPTSSPNRRPHHSPV